MSTDTLELDQMQAAYKAAVEEWVAAIKEEEALASVNHSVAEVDQWEAAHFKEDDMRQKVIVDDTAKLLTLAQQLKEEADKGKITKSSGAFTGWRFTS